MRRTTDSRGKSRNATNNDTIELEKAGLPFPALRRLRTLTQGEAKGPRPNLLG
jgi:hypothetical protein